MGTGYLQIRLYFPAREPHQCSSLCFPYVGAASALHQARLLHGCWGSQSHCHTSSVSPFLSEPSSQHPRKFVSDEDIPTRRNVTLKMIIIILYKGTRWLESIWAKRAGAIEESRCDRAVRFFLGSEPQFWLCCRKWGAWLTWVQGSRMHKSGPDGPAYTQHGDSDWPW